MCVCVYTTYLNNIVFLILEAFGEIVEFKALFSPKKQCSNQRDNSKTLMIRCNNVEERVKVEYNDSLARNESGKGREILMTCYNLA